MKHLLTVPNMLTGFRFALVPVLIVLFSVEQTTVIEMACFLVFTIAALTDFVDGYVARKYRIETVLGKLMDPLADKVLVTTALVMLIPLGKITAWVCLLIICREIIVTGFRGLGFLISPLGVLPVPYQHEIGTILIYESVDLLGFCGVFAYLVRDQGMWKN